MPNININILIRSYSHRYYLEYRSRSQAHVGLRIAYISESRGPSIPLGGRLCSRIFATASNWVLKHLYSNIQFFLPT